MNKSRRPLTLYGIIGLVLTGLVLLFVLIGCFYTPYDPEAMDASAKNLSPSLAHLFGTDNYGRDLLSRVMVGARMTFFIGLLTVLIGGILGTIVGAFTGYLGGVFDAVIMRINDGILAFPSILLALVLIGIFGPGEKNVIIALGILFIPSFARVVRGEVLRQKQLDYVTNAKLMGAGTIRIIFVHILPNLTSVWLVTMAIGFNNAVLAEAGLSFLGLGVQPPKCSLGRMLSEAQSYLRLSPWYALFPGLAIVLCLLGVSMLQEELTGTRRQTRSSKQKAAWTKTVTNDRAAEGKVLSVRKLHAGFYGEVKNQETEILKGISFDLYAGETLGLVGESGSGKSMTALSIMELLPKNAWKTGEVTLQSPAIAMVFQEAMTALSPVMRIERQMKLILHAHGIKQEKEKEHELLLEALREVDLDEGEQILRSYPHELSGGMRQRILIAMALLEKPDVLLADEPTTALDRETQVEVLALLKRLQSKYHMAILFISHDLEVVKAICERVLVMNEGEIVEQGSTEEIFTNPQHCYTEELLRAAKGANYRELLVQEKEPEVVLEAKHLHVYYGKKKKLFRPLSFEKEVLKDFSITVHKGDVFGILGRSGSGKTTFAKCLLGLNKGNMIGQIRCQKEIGMVFQDPYSSLNESKSVLWLLEEPLRNDGVSKKERRQEAMQMLDEIGLDASYASRQIRELSGGQRQRIAIGIAMMAKPEILILDEPVSALDVTVQEQILGLLTKFHNQFGLTYLLISHDESVMNRMTTDRSVIEN